MESLPPIPFDLKCMGSLVLLDASGENHSPKNVKTLGVLALLARADGLRRSRRWIESMLWSDRAQPQASGSLRQALSEIRTCLGDHRAGLVSDRRNVALDPKVIAVSFRPSENGTGAELFEGLDVRDAEFEAWLTLERRQYVEKNSQRMTLMTPPTEPNGGVPSADLTVMIKESDNPMARAIMHQTSQNLGEFSNMELVGENSGRTADLILSMNVLAAKTSKHVSMQLTLADGSILWTASRDVSSSIEKGVFSISNEASESVLRAMRKHPRAKPTEKLRERALDELFSFDAARLRVADGLLLAAQEYDPDPMVLAWQAFLRMIIVNERLEDDLDRIRDEAREYARRAMELGHENPTLLAVLSQVNLFLGFDSDGVEVLGRIGADRNPGSAMAQMSLCTMALRNGKIEEARHLARRSLVSTGHGRLTHWSHMLNCLTEIAGGNYRTAARHAESAIALAPSFRPPLRHLYALDIEAGRLSRANVSLNKLRKQEPQFSLSMMREVPEYPATTLRESGLLKYQDLED